MAPDPDKIPKVGKRVKDNVQSNCKYKEYEKKRRDLFTDKLDTLAQLLPNYDKENPWKKLDILENAIICIREKLVLSSKAYEESIKKLVQEIFQLKGLIHACTELKYRQEDIYQLSATQIGHRLKEINEINNRLIDQKPNGPVTAPSSPPKTTVSVLAPKPIGGQAAVVQCQVLPNLGQTLIIPASYPHQQQQQNQQPATAVIGTVKGEFTHQLDHAYSVQTKAEAEARPEQTENDKTAEDLVSVEVGSGGSSTETVTSNTVTARSEPAQSSAATPGTAEAATLFAAAPTASCDELNGSVVLYPAVSQLSSLTPVTASLVRAVKILPRFYPTAELLRPTAIPLQDLKTSDGKVLSGIAPRLVPAPLFLSSDGRHLLGSGGPPTLLRPSAVAAATVTTVNQGSRTSVLPRLGRLPRRLARKRPAQPAPQPDSGSNLAADAKSKMAKLDSSDKTLLQQQAGGVKQHDDNSVQEAQGEQVQGQQQQQDQVQQHGEGSVTSEEPQVLESLLEASLEIEMVEEAIKEDQQQVANQRTEQNTSEERTVSCESIPEEEEMKKKEDEKSRTAEAAESVDAAAAAKEQRRQEKKKNIYSIPALCQISVHIGERPDLVNSPGVMSLNSVGTVSPSTTPAPTPEPQRPSGGESSSSKSVLPHQNNTDPVIEELKTIRPEDVSILHQVELSSSVEEAELRLLKTNISPSRTFLTSFPVVSKHGEPDSCDAGGISSLTSTPKNIHQEISEALNDLDSELSLATNNMQQQLNNKMDNSTPGPHYDLHHHKERSSSLASAESAATLTSCNADPPEPSAASVYDFSATKVETPPVPLQKSRREAAAAKSPRQAAGPAVKTDDGGHHGKRQQQQNQQPQQLPEAKKQQHPQQPQQQSLQLRPQQQHHQQQQQPPVSVIAGSPTVVNTSYPTNPELAYMDARVRHHQGPAIRPEAPQGRGIISSSSNNSNSYSSHAPPPPLPPPLLTTARPPINQPLAPPRQAAAYMPHYHYQQHQQPHHSYQQQQQLHHQQPYGQVSPAVVSSEMKGNQSGGPFTFHQEMKYPVAAASYASSPATDFNMRHSSGYYKQYPVAQPQQQQCRANFQQPLAAGDPNNVGHQQQQQYLVRNSQQQQQSAGSNIAADTNSSSSNNSGDHSKPDIATSTGPFSVNQLVNNPTAAAGGVPHHQLPHHQQQRKSSSKKSPAGSGSGSKPSKQQSAVKTAAETTGSKDKQPDDQRKAAVARSSGGSSGSSRRNRSGNRSNYSAESLFGGNQGTPSGVGTSAVAEIGGASSSGGKTSKISSSANSPRVSHSSASAAAQDKGGNSMSPYSAPSFSSSSSRHNVAPVSWSAGSGGGGNSAVVSSGSNSNDMMMMMMNPSQQQYGFSSLSPSPGLFSGADLGSFELGIFSGGLPPDSGRDYLGNAVTPSNPTAGKSPVAAASAHKQQQHQQQHQQQQLACQQQHHQQQQHRSATTALVTDWTLNSAMLIDNSGGGGSGFLPPVPTLTPPTEDSYSNFMMTQMSHHHHHHHHHAAVSAGFYPCTAAAATPLPAIVTQSAGRGSKAAAANSALLSSGAQTSSSSSSLVNFNLSTIFPEINIGSGQGQGPIGCQSKPLPGLSAGLPEFLHGSSRPGQLATPDLLPHSLLLGAHQDFKMMPTFTVTSGISANVVPGLAFPNMPDQ